MKEKIRLSVLFFKVIYFLNANIWAQIHPMVHIGVTNGNVLPTNDFLKGENLALKRIEEYKAINIQLGISSTDKKDWAVIYRQPYYGIGVSFNDFLTSELGKPISGYGYLGIPIIRSKYFSIYNEWQYGMAFGWKHYHPNLNPKNHAIGSKITVHAASQLMLKAHILPYIDLTGGISFVHFSNGRMERPNNGINIITSSIGLNIYPNKQAKYIKPKREVNLKKPHEWALTIGYGNHQRNSSVDDTNYFAVAGLSGSFAKQHSNYYRSRIGLDMNYFWSLTVEEDGSQAKPGWTNLTLGVVYQPEFIIGNFTMYGGIGLYLKHANYVNYQQMYQRLGLRYNFMENFSFAANIRSVNFYEAEFLEFQFGYHFLSK